MAAECPRDSHLSPVHSTSSSIQRATGRLHDLWKDTGFSHCSSPSSHSRACAAWAGPVAANRAHRTVLLTERAERRRPEAERTAGKGPGGGLRYKVGHSQATRPGFTVKHYRCREATRDENGMSRLSRGGKEGEAPRKRVSRTHVGAQKPHVRTGAAEGPWAGCGGRRSRNPTAPTPGALSSLLALYRPCRTTVSSAHTEL